MQASANADAWAWRLQPVNKMFLLSLIVAAVIVGAAVFYTARVFRREQRRERRRIERVHRHLAG